MNEGRKKLLKRTVGIGLALLCLFALVILYVSDPESSTLDVCFFDGVLGLDCPGCGMTRAFNKLLHLDFAAALDYNIFSPVIFLLLCVVFGAICFQLITGKTIKYTPPLWPIAVLLILLLVFGVVRNLPFEPFTYLHT